MVNNIPVFLYVHPFCLPDVLMSLKEFILNDNVNHFIENEKPVTVRVNWWGLSRQWTICDFSNYYNQPNIIPYFNAYGAIVVDAYYDENKSLEIIIELLNYRFNGEDTEIIAFLDKLVAVLDKKKKIQS